jgi:hypothetical protein
LRQIDTNALGAISILVAGAIAITGCFRVGYDPATRQAGDAGDVSAGDGKAPEEDAGHSGHDEDAGEGSDLDGGAGMGDAGTDAGADAGSDAGADAGTDAGADAGSDAGSDAGTDAGTDAGSTSNWDSEWEFRKPLTIRSSELDLTGDLFDFPLLVSRTDVELSDGVGKSDGSDISFTSSDGIALPREIERFDVATGELIAWVRIPELSLSDDTTIYMYYGNPFALEPNAATVWDSEFFAVHHMASRFDSTAHQNHATVVGDAHFGSAGAIGHSGIVDGAGDGYELPDIVQLRGVSQLTFSAWVRMDGPSQVQVIGGRTGNDSTGWGMTSGSSVASSADPIPEGHDDIVLSVGALGPMGVGHNTTGNVIAFAPALQHWVGVFDGTQSNVNLRGRIYIDGEEFPTENYGGGLPTQTPVAVAGHVISIATTVTNFGGTTSLRGTIDEVRLSRTARSSAWIRVEHANQNDPQGFVTAAAQELRDD